MNKKIKIIDLINMQYKKEKMPKNIRIKYSFKYNYYTYNEEIKWYEIADKTTILNVFRKLDYEVEILEDNTEEIDIQEIEEIIDFRTSDDELYNDNFSDFKSTINELVQAVKQLDKNIKDKE